MSIQGERICVLQLLFVVRFDLATIGEALYNAHGRLMDASDLSLTTLDFTILRDLTSSGSSAPKPFSVPDNLEEG